MHCWLGSGLQSNHGPTVHYTKHQWALGGILHLAGCGYDCTRLLDTSKKLRDYFVGVVSAMLPFSSSGILMEILWTCKPLEVRDPLEAGLVTRMSVLVHSGQHRTVGIAQVALALLEGVSPAALVK